MKMLKILSVFIICLMISSACYSDVKNGEPCQKSKNGANRCPPAWITETITSNDFETLKSYKNPITDFVALDSGGGDLYAAIDIARFLRKRGGYTAIVPPKNKCLSACVMILAGASRRQVMGQVGIHRPYPLTISPNKTVEQIRQEQTQLQTVVRSYLNEVGVSPTLYDEMVTTPPQRMKVLSEAELQHFGLSEDDPAVDEDTDVLWAKTVGVSMQELLKRKAKSEHCDGDMDCFMAAIWGVPVPEFRRRQSLAKTNCSAKAAYDGCANRIMQTGK